MNSSEEIIRKFHIAYYESGENGGTFAQTRWRGIPTRKCPLDLWVYQELIHELRPKLIVETGTFGGGSANFLADTMKLCGIEGQVITIDIKARPPAGHPMVQYVNASSTDPNMLAWLRAQAEGKSPVMVSLDSDHSKDHVLAELRCYAPLVTVGSYLIAEDTNLNGRPVRADFGPGPGEAVETFLSECGGAFEVDRSKEKYLLTFNPGGFLKRVK